jgi:hypothetical protein
MSAFGGRTHPVSATRLVVYPQGFRIQGLARALIEPPLAQNFLIVFPQVIRLAVRS